MSSETISVSASYWRREQLVVEMPSGTLMADHPVSLGGEGRGPSAGELVLLALCSGAVLSVGAEAQRRHLDVASAMSRATFQSVRERIDGPMATVSCMAHLQHRLELAFAGDYQDARALTDAAADNPVARAMGRGIPLDEYVELERTDGPRSVNEFRNETMWADEQVWTANALGEKVVAAPEGRWRVGASLLDANAALLHHDHQLYAAGFSTAQRKVGPSPNELLAASLAACTVFYIAHNARFRSIPVERIRATAIATVDDTGAIASMVKTAYVTGNLTDDEMASIEFMANNCYVGVTMKRSVDVGFEVELVSPSASPSAPMAEAACDDGSCCIPDFRVSTSLPD
jgi:uncharacterized OsmC-like protein